MVNKKSAYVIYEWPPSLLDDSDEDDIDAGPAKKSRPSNQGYFAGLPRPVKSRNIDQTSRVKTIQIIDNEEVTHEDSDIVSCCYFNTILYFLRLHSLLQINFLLPCRSFEILSKHSSLRLVVRQSSGICLAVVKIVQPCRLKDFSVLSSLAVIL